MAPNSSKTTKETVETAKTTNVTTLVKSHRFVKISTLACASSAATKTSASVITPVVSSTSLVAGVTRDSSLEIDDILEKLTESVRISISTGNASGNVQTYG